MADPGQERLIGWVLAGHEAAFHTAFRQHSNAVPDPTGTGGAVLNISVVDVAASRRMLETPCVSFRGETVVIPGKVALAAFADPDGTGLVSRAPHR